jgi:hypothetical protein
MHLIKILSLLICLHSKYLLEKDYSLVKNSYSTKWGENGYIRIKRGSNVSGIESNPYYPIV